MYPDISAFSKRTGRFVCVAGTNTSAGKTFVTAGLLRAARLYGVAARAVKTIQTGCETTADGSLLAPDLSIYAEAAPESENCVLYKFLPPCSPHLAAMQAGVNLSVAELSSKMQAKWLNDGLNLVEAAGGLLVPLNSRQTNADLFKAVDALVLLVVDNKLGAINDALLSLELLKSRGVKVGGFILNNATRPDSADEDFDLRLRQENRLAISGFSGVSCLAELEHYPSMQSHDAALRQSTWEAVALELAPVLEFLFGKGEGFGNVLGTVPGVTPKATTGAAGGSFSEALPEVIPADDTESAVADLLFDQEHIWHPYAPAKAALRPLLAEEASACNIRTADGKNLVDGVSAWWSAIHGHRHPRILGAIAAQSRLMPHVMFGGFTHRPAVRLTERLLNLAPTGLEHVFYSDSGSVAVEVALKMAILYQQRKQRPERKAIMTIRGGYHGDTLGAMSVCDPGPGMHSPFAGMGYQVIFADRPETAFKAEYTEKSTARLEAFFAEHAQGSAAFILEPVMQGAGEMWFYHPGYVADIARLCREHDVLFIADEVATGFGRTGRMFACEWSGCTPDIMTVGKGLSAGTVGLAATLVSSATAEVISRGGSPFMHGPTFMANPLACAVAEASLDILQEKPYGLSSKSNPAKKTPAAGDWQAAVWQIESGLEAGLEPLRHIPEVQDVRVLGSVGVVELNAPVNTAALQDYFVNEHRVWLRPFGRIIYIMPPYIVSAGELGRLTTAVQEAVKGRKWVF